MPTNSAALNTDKAALPSKPACQLLNPRAHTEYHKAAGKLQQPTPSAEAGNRGRTRATRQPDAGNRVTIQTQQ